MEKKGTEEVQQNYTSTITGLEFHTQHAMPGDGQKLLYQQPPFTRKTMLGWV